MLDLFQADCEDGVRAGGCVVHFGRGRRSGLDILLESVQKETRVETYHIAHFHQPLHINITLHFSLSQALYVYAISLRLPNLEVYRWGRAWYEKVPDMLVVDFEVRDVDVVVGVGLRLGVYPLEELFTCARNKTWIIWRPHHGITLSRSRLSVREDACVVAIEVVVQEVLAERAVDVILVSIVRVLCIMRPEGLVECELLVIVNLPGVWVEIAFVWRKKCSLLGRWVHANEALGSFVAFYLQLAYPTGHRSVD